jgi:CheY-like chemotaxis protein
MQNEQAHSGALEALVVENDLFFAVRIETTLKRMGYRVHTVGSAAAARDALGERVPALVLVSFGKDALAPGEVTRLAKSLPEAPPVLGYISHVILAEKRAEAKEAGCDLLVPNSAVAMRLPMLIERLLARDIAAAEEIAEEEDEYPSA